MLIYHTVVIREVSIRKEGLTTLQISYQYRQHSQQQLIYKYHIFLVSGQVSSIFDNRQIFPFAERSVPKK